MKRKCQGEIFGVALIFVVLVLGMVIYGKIEAMTPDKNIGLDIEKKYKLLAEKSLTTILESSTGCYLEKDKDTVKDLVKHCVYYQYAGREDPQISCLGGKRVGSCSQVISMLNKSLLEYFNSSEGIGFIPYKLTIDTEEGVNNKLTGVVLTNFGSIKDRRGKILTETNYLQKGYNKVPSEPQNVITASRLVEFNLYVYYY